MDELAAALDPAGSGFVASRTRAVKIQGDGDRFWSAGPFCRSSSKLRLGIMEWRARP